MKNKKCFLNLHAGLGYLKGSSSFLLLLDRETRGDAQLFGGATLSTSSETVAVFLSLLLLLFFTLFAVIS